MPNALRVLSTLAVASLLASSVSADNWEKLTTRVVLAPKQAAACGLAKMPEKLKARRGSKVSWKLASDCAEDIWIIVGNFVPAEDPSCKPASEAPPPVGRDCRPEQVRPGKQATLQCVVDREAAEGCWRYDIMQADPEQPGDPSRWKTIADPEIEIRD